MIVKIDASDKGYDGILKQDINGKESLVCFHSGVWNNAQQNYSTVKKEVVLIVLSVQKFQGDLINKDFLVRTDSKASKFIFEKDVKNFISKQIFARWQAILSCFDFTIEPIKGTSNCLANYLSREHISKHKLSKSSGNSKNDFELRSSTATGETSASYSFQSAKSG